MSKSYVSVEQKICLVTAKPFEVGILINTRIKGSFEDRTITGWGICPEVEEKFKEGYIALVGIISEKSEITDNRVLPENAWRTGNIAYIRRVVFQRIVEDFPIDINWIFVDQAFLDKLATMTEENLED